MIKYRTTDEQTRLIPIDTHCIE